MTKSCASGSRRLIRTRSTASALKRPRNRRKANCLPGSLWKSSRTRNSTSMTLVDRSDDLRRLIEEEYDLEIRDGNLLVHHVPFVNGAGGVEYCTLVSDLSTNGERTIQPGRHEVWVVGSVPHDHRGNEVSFIADRDRLDYGGGVVACCRLSLKPGGRMPVDYYAKFSNYVRVLSGYARGIDAGATHKNYPVRQTSPDESVFRYHDAATSRSG